MERSKGAITSKAPLCTVKLVVEALPEKVLSPKLTLEKSTLLKAEELVAPEII